MFTSLATQKCITITVMLGGMRQKLKLNQEHVERRGVPQPETFPRYRMILRVHNAYLEGRIPGTRSGRMAIMPDANVADADVKEVERYKFWKSKWVEVVQNVGLVLQKKMKKHQIMLCAGSQTPNKILSLVLEPLTAKSPQVKMATKIKMLTLLNDASGFSGNRTFDYADRSFRNSSEINPGGRMEPTPACTSNTTKYGSNNVLIMGSPGDRSRPSDSSGLPQ
ncbi:unnamed protein product [Colias eurytheme]|nr:unnamed protein product [Colias eurytheme]